MKGKNGTSRKIHRSKDYSQFKAVKWNRQIDKGKVERISHSITEKNLLADCPILITQDGHVIDGQHRLEAAKMLGVYIYYIVAESSTVDDISRHNMNMSNWKNIDFLHMYCEKGYPEYQKIQKFMKRWSIGFTDAQRVLGKTGCGNSAGSNSNHRGKKTSGSGLWKGFRDGNFRYPENDTYAHDFMQSYRAMQNTGGIKNSSTLVALIRMNKTDGFDLSRMVKQYENHYGEYTESSSASDCIRQLETIYNKGLTHKIYMRRTA